MNAVSTAIENMQATQRTLAGRTVVYRRAGQEISVTAVVGSSREVTVDTAGTMVAIRFRDYLISRADLDLGFGPIAPEVGDEIDVTIAGVVETWQVHPTSDERGYRASDDVGSQWRIHTKRVK